MTMSTLSHQWWVVGASVHTLSLFTPTALTTQPSTLQKHGFRKRKNISSAVQYSTLSFEFPQTKKIGGVGGTPISVKFLTRCRPLCMSTRMPTCVMAKSMQT